MAGHKSFFTTIIAPASIKFINNHVKFNNIYVTAHSESSRYFLLLVVLTKFP